MSDEPKATTQAAVYVSFATLNHALDDLSQGIPNVVDKSAFPGLSGGVQNQLMAGMRFLGLIDEAGRPQPALEKLAVAEVDSRKAALRDILQSKYKEIFALDLLKMTPAQLKECMVESYSVSGDTRDKAVRFFLSAVRYAGIPVSRYLQVTTSAPAGTRKRRSTGRSTTNGVDDENDDDDEQPQAAPSATKTIMLKSGGSITVSAVFDMFNISDADRKFLLDIIDKLKAYDPEPESIGAHLAARKI
jgi:hypothetical protein